MRVRGFTPWSAPAVPQRLAQEVQFGGAPHRTLQQGNGIGLGQGLQNVSEENHIVASPRGTIGREFANVTDVDVVIQVTGMRLHPGGIDFDAVDADPPLLGLDTAGPDIQVLARQDSPQPEADPGIEHRPWPTMGDCVHALFHSQRRRTCCLTAGVRN